MGIRFQHINIAVAYFLLAIYSLVLSWGSIVSHIDADHHNEHPIEHSIEEEQNVCHLKIHHQDEIQGCDHNSHYQKHSHHCDFCDATIQKIFQLPVSSNQHHQTFEVGPVRGFDEIKYLPCHILLDRSRGPPANFFS